MYIHVERSWKYENEAQNIYKLFSNPFHLAASAELFHISFRILRSIF